MSTPIRKLNVLPLAGSPDLGHTLSAATSHDLVLGLVGYAGAGATRVAASLAEQLKEKGYRPVHFKLSELIIDIARSLDYARAADLDAKRPVDRTKALQAAGAWLRGQHGESITAGLAIHRIHTERPQPGLQQPMAFLVDSLKHPLEIQVLRNVYKSSFYLVSVICHEDIRRRRLQGNKYKDANRQEIDEVLQRDEADRERAGQHVRKTLHLGDFFINNYAEYASSDADPLAEYLARFVDIIAGTEIVRPTRDERGMLAGWTAALRSACLSRQVGAAILDAQGNLIATGTNDVPKFGGGLYGEDDHEDHRCFVDQGERSEPYCRNDIEKQEIYDDIAARLRDNRLLKEEASPEAVRDAIASTRVGALIEFSRAVHAEMDAVVSLARSGRGSSQDATLYCTTYPCHNCARHIVAAGIREVVYIEPYPKSLAVKLHGDSIMELTRRAENAHGGGALKRREDVKKKSEDTEKVHFRLFSGVAPKRFATLFEKRGDLKDLGLAVKPQRDTPEHIDFVYTKSFIDFEKEIAAAVAKLKTQKGAQAGE